MQPADPGARAGNRHRGHDAVCEAALVPVRLVVNPQRPYQRLGMDVRGRLTRIGMNGNRQFFPGRTMRPTYSTSDWAAPVSPDTLDGNMCPGENDENEKEVHG